VPIRERLAELGCNGGELGGAVADLFTMFWSSPDRHEAVATEALAFEPALTGDVVWPVATSMKAFFAARDYC
jgi:hypothetical protein